MMRKWYTYMYEEVYIYVHKKSWSIFPFIALWVWDPRERVGLTFGQVLGGGRGIETRPLIGGDLKRHFLKRFPLINIYPWEPFLDIFILRGTWLP